MGHCRAFRYFLMILELTSDGQNHPGTFLPGDQGPTQHRQDVAYHTTHKKHTNHYASLRVLNERTVVWMAIDRQLCGRGFIRFQT
jgi:hypothetical protein